MTPKVLLDRLASVPTHEDMGHMFRLLLQDIEATTAKEVLSVEEAAAALKSLPSHQHVAKTRMKLLEAMALAQMNEEKIDANAQEQARDFAALKEKQRQLRLHLRGELIDLRRELADAEALDEYEQDSTYKSAFSSSSSSKQRALGPSLSSSFSSSFSATALTPSGLSSSVRSSAYAAALQSASSAATRSRSRSRSHALGKGPLAGDGDRDRTEGVTGQPVAVLQRRQDKNINGASTSAAGANPQSLGPAGQVSGLSSTSSTANIPTLSSLLRTDMKLSPKEALELSLTALEKALADLPGLKKALQRVDGIATGLKSALTRTRGNVTSMTAETVGLGPRVHSLLADVDDMLSCLPRAHALRAALNKAHEDVFADPDDVDRSISAKVVEIDKNKAEAVRLATGFSSRMETHRTAEVVMGLSAKEAHARLVESRQAVASTEILANARAKFDRSLCMIEVWEPKIVARLEALQQHLTRLEQEMEQWRQGLVDQIEDVEAGIRLAGLLIKDSQKLLPDMTRYVDAHVTALRKGVSEAAAEAAHVRSQVRNAHVLASFRDVKARTVGLVSFRAGSSLGAPAPALLDLAPSQTCIEHQWEQHEKQEAMARENDQFLKVAYLFSALSSPSPPSVPSIPWDGP